MADKSWKRAEREVARLLTRTCPACGHVTQPRRVPVTGRNRGDAPDVTDPDLSIEVKHRKSLPDWLHDAMEQAEAAVTSEGQLPVVVLHEARQPYGRSFVVVRLESITEED